ncbi:MAG: porin family protein, partial [bacterium]
MKCSYVRWIVATGVAAVWISGLAAAHAQKVEAGDEHPLYFGVGIGFLDFDGGQPVRDGCFPALHVGYDFNDRLSLDAQFRVLPSLRGQYRYDSQTGEQFNRLWEQTGGINGGVDGTWGYGAALDALYHFTRWERLDPYLAVGVGYDWYQHSFYDPGYTLALRMGGGVMYHLNDEWAIRVDIRGYPVGNQNKVNANSEYEVGVVWTFGAHTPARLSAHSVIPVAVAPVNAPAITAKTTAPVLPKPDDLQMFKLDLVVAQEGQWHPEYFSELDAIAKAIQSHPGSEVWIE